MPVESLIIRASGNHYDLGFAVGRNASGLIRNSLDYYRDILRREGWIGPWKLPEGYIEAARNIYPHYLEELQGMAAGSSVKFEDLFFLNALEEALETSSSAACTAIGIYKNNQAWLGHNEDWYAEDSRSVIIIEGRPKGKPAFISVTAAPFLPAVGMNEAGIAQGVNSLIPEDFRIGIPRMFAARAVLEAESIEEAVTYATPERRAGGYNHLLVHKNGQLANLETSAEKNEFITANDSIYHTNHYTGQLMKELEKGTWESSKSRYSRLEELHNLMAENDDSFQMLAGVLGDHRNRPASICRHSEENSGEATIFSVIFNVTTSRAWVAVGNPCLNRYSELKIF
jgi:predicted choloylglycine hydrolase